MVSKTLEDAIGKVVDKYKDKLVALTEVSGVKHVQVSFSTGTYTQSWNRPRYAMIDCRRISCADNLEFAIECMQYCRLNPGVIVNRNKLATSIAYHQGNILQYARKNKKLPDINGTKGSTMHNLMAEVLKDIYGITVPRFNLAQHIKDEKKRYAAIRRVLAAA